MTTQPPPEAKLLDKFSDGISSLRYLSKNNSNNDDDDGRRKLASTSWDGAVRIHDTTSITSSNNASSTSTILSHNMESGPLLSLAIPYIDNVSSDVGTSGALATGGLDGSIKWFDIATSTVRCIGRHIDDESVSSNNSNNNGKTGEAGSISSKNACSCLAAMKQHPNLLVSASWNKQLCVWDIRTANKAVVTRVNLPGKAFAMDVDENRSRILVATSGRYNCFFDLRTGTANLTSSESSPSSSDNPILESVLQRESSLKFQTRCVSFFPDGHGVAVGSIEGRVACEFLEELGLPNKEGLKKYAFKCHRVGDTVYPVNTIAFHPKFTNTFATGGCDGTVVLWDGQHKKKLTALPVFPTSISALTFSPDGKELAIASSYTYEEGDREHPQDEIYIRPILESEVIGKSMQHCTANLF